MGRMKEIFIEICNANNGQLPGELTTGDVARMVEFEIYNWQEYEREVQKRGLNSSDEAIRKIINHKTKFTEEKEQEDPF